MDAFRLRSQVVGDYSEYVRSFLNILDPEIRLFVDEQLGQGVLWPDPLLQLSPAYQQAETIDDLVAKGHLHPLCGQLFRNGGTSLRLHQHQRRALEIAERGENYVVTSGTGSGKSLTYIVPIFDHVLRHQPQLGGVRAIVVYPMNALINSQTKALDRFLGNLAGGECPVRYARYTGQESRSEKQAIRDNPPHILLTNYVMLELMLTRPEERPFVETTGGVLSFLVLDELHTYRGRQGADVALLVRRVRERSGNNSLQCIGTSATMASGESRAERIGAVADVAGKIFGAALPLENVVEEVLRWGLPRPSSPDPLALRSALAQPLSEKLDWAELSANPLAAWIETTFGLREDDSGKLRRREPITLREGARQLAQITAVEEDSCVLRLRQLFQLGSKVQNPEGAPVFAFKLHQFFSQGGSVHATVERSAQRYLTLEGQHYAPGGDGARVLFPLVFCRECGQHYYLSTHNRHDNYVAPRLAETRGNDSGYDEGYLFVDDEGFWPDEHLDLLPENWLRELKRGVELKPEYAPFRPRKLRVRQDGSLAGENDEAGLRCWFIAAPFLTCLRCGEIYTRRQRSDFSKLARLSSEGRSTATTLLTLSAVTQMRSEQNLDASARKLLSFTDNRQDASLQAGHFNDFVSVALLRAALYRAVRDSAVPLDHTTIAARTVAQLGLAEADFAKEVGRVGPLSKRNSAALRDLIEYRVYEDLRRGWRVTQPNLEQCGLLLIEYDELDAVCDDEPAWQGNSLLAVAAPAVRLTVIRALLDYMRRELALSAEILQPDAQEALRKRVRETLRDPWSIDENEYLYSATRFVMPGTPVGERGERSLSGNTTIGRYLRSRQTWPGADADLNQEEYTRLAEAIVLVLRGAGYLVEVEAEAGRALQLRSDTLLWRLGSGGVPPRDPVRRRRMNLPYDSGGTPNPFFSRFYQDAAGRLRGIEGREHTGQVGQQQREEREERFREGALAALFCSPTMELGIDIADLNVVHLRNVPPTPANYAQRAGRAGRSGQPAFLATYCSAGSGHDQYFFRRPERMVAGVVAPPRIELANEELVRAHAHAVWLAATATSLGDSMIGVLDTADVARGYPLRHELAAKLALSSGRQREVVAACQRMLFSAQADLARSAWFSDRWLEDVITRAPAEFDRTCHRWRELYAAAERQLQEARADTDRRYHGRGSQAEADEARRREGEALRQKNLLVNEGEEGDNDFYPYRYFASEGFLPGYNFPRLPVQAYLPTSREHGAFLSRPRFLALSEFGPRNVIYHEGRKYRVTRTFLPAGGAESRLRSAKLCNNCGFFHEGVEAAPLDFCEHCNSRLDGDTSLTTNRLFEMMTVATQRTERITSEEEERMREGFEITTHFRFAPKDAGERQAGATARAQDGTALLKLTYAPAATLWRINHRWWRSPTPGYTLDLKRGVWGKRQGDEADQTADIAIADRTMNGLRLLVRDTRNLLLLHPQEARDENVLASLQYALQRGIEAVFQVSEQEIASERIGVGSWRGVMFWEAAEGGLGVLSRLVDDPGALAQVARVALEILHFDPNGADVEVAARDCARACYRCLLSYSNQPDHALLDRHMVRDLLLLLASATASTTANLDGGTGSAMIAGQAGFYGEVLDALKASGRRMPDLLRPMLEGVAVQPDLYYESGAVCVFCDEAVPDSAARRRRDELVDAGYRVIALQRDGDLQSQLRRWASVFGGQER